MEVYYGIEGRYTNVTYLSYLKFYKDGILRIPAGENERSKVFGDPILNVLKHIKINDVIYSHEQEIVIETPEIKGNSRKEWWDKVGKYIQSPEERLSQLHAYLIIDFGSKTEEYPEQLMAMKFIKETDTVLEIGANIGRNTCVIASILDDDSRLVTLECSETHVKQLEHNRNQNFFNFHIEASALSKVPLIQKGWDTFVSETVPTGFTKVNTITFAQLLTKYGLNFDVLVADCEGALYQILIDEPKLLENIKTIIIENDFKDISKKEYVDKVFIENGFSEIYRQGGGWGPCQNFFFQVFSKDLMNNSKDLMNNSKDLMNNSNNYSIIIFAVFLIIIIIIAIILEYNIDIKNN